MFDQHQGNVAVDFQMRNFTVEVTTLQVEGAITQVAMTNLICLQKELQKIAKPIYPSCTFLSFLLYRL